MKNDNLRILSGLISLPLLLVSMEAMSAANDVTISAGSNSYSCKYNTIQFDSTGNANIVLTDGNCLAAADLDTDGDGYSDAVELAEVPPTDINDENSKPVDTDGDFQPDRTDLDDDNDGYTDAEETAAGTDPLDSTSKPVTPPPPSSQGPLVHEPDFVQKYNMQPAYSTKADLLTAQIDNKDYYIVNPGLSSFTSLPSCVNGKSVQHQCSPTGWSMGIDDNDVFALRYMTKSSYRTAKLTFDRSEIARGALKQANYKINISKVPGKMTPDSTYAGRCSFDTQSSKGALYFTKPGTQPYVNYGIYCEVPAGEEFYVNVVLAPSSYSSCKNSLCGGMISGAKLQTPNY